jgi:hypothetical protein
MVIFIDLAEEAVEGILFRLISISVNTEGRGEVVEVWFVKDEWHC